MKYLFVFCCLVFFGCVKQDYGSATYREKCNKECMEKTGRPVNWVGNISGDCYCE